MEISKPAKRVSFFSFTYTYTTYSSDEYDRTSCLKCCDGPIMLDNTVTSPEFSDLQSINPYVRTFDDCFNEIEESRKRSRLEITDDNLEMLEKFLLGEDFASLL